MPYRFLSLFSASYLSCFRGDLLLRAGLVTAAIVTALVVAGSAQSRNRDAARTGGIRVRGWDRGDVLVRTRIMASADTDAEARRLTNSVRVDTAGGRVRASGPDMTRHEHWHISFELQVPRTAI